MSEPIDELPGFDDVLSAMGRIRNRVHRTAVLSCEAIDRVTGARVLFKCENFQKVGAFKFRGASHAVACLSDEEAARGVATHSSGNHAAALALAARRRGIPATIVMPRNAPAVKVAAVREYGGRIVFCEPTLQAREDALAQVVEETGARFVHPYDDPQVIAGQGTAALELLEDHPDLELILAPVGGGGLLSGTCLAAEGLAPRARVVGAEPQGADDAWRSLQAGHIVPSSQPDTIADGLLTSLGDKTFAILQRRLHSIVTVSDHEIVRAMRLVWERMKIVIEPSSAVPVAALIERRVELRGPVGVILSGGNVDLERLPWMGEPT